EPFVSRSELKLREALAAFGMGGSLRARGDALDLGAAPGGWTKVLAEAGMRVAAVDPADLHPYVAGMDGVTHRREGYGAFLTRGMAFDLIACDMRLDPHESVAAMASFAGSLASGGAAVVTLKLPRRNAQGIAKACVARLSGAYMLIGARQLFYNRSEVTVALRKA
ncbi:MAG: hypothetical protein FWE70_03490, partial [Oscillospiraceae bacterium]|nr:hypothetical protein [Oscillospiraceae bacterium]